MFQLLEQTDGDVPLVSVETLAQDRAEPPVPGQRLPVCAVPVHVPPALSRQLLRLPRALELSARLPG